MPETKTLSAEARGEFGKNAARRLRRSGRIPAVVYGDHGEPVPVTVDPRKILKLVETEAGHNAIFTLEINGKEPARVMLRDWMMDPVKGELLHADFVRVARDTKLKIKVPIHLTGEAKGVKVQGGILEFLVREVEMECLPDDIPDSVSVDVTELTMGKNVRVADLPVGQRVKVLTDSARVVVHVVALRAEEEKPAAEAAEAAPAEPEVIRKGKAETEEEGAEAEEGKGEGKGKKEGKKE